ncbi:unnamed protein product [Peronospora destructor]|uniref:Uncharacterized protein n=1 Tax=Peronospora destructor TaxID=86335 RepID=A0AAV0SWZ5_9STRA|nr:unnamed protein product [Peronospora destructor]
MTPTRRPTAEPFRFPNAVATIIGIASRRRRLIVRTSTSSYGKKHKACSLLRVPCAFCHSSSCSLLRVQENESFFGRDCSPTGAEEEDTWSDSDFKQRMRLASVCSSNGSEHGGLGRQHLEEFIRMEISAVNESEHQLCQLTLGIKGRFVKKEDEELLCQLLSYT